MYRVESSMYATGMARAVGERGGPPPISAADGALDMARNAVRQALESAGFVNVTGQSQENFEVFLNRSPVEMPIEDLKPGLLIDVASWVCINLPTNPQRALEGQAHVQPEAAIKLLT